MFQKIVLSVVVFISLVVVSFFLIIKVIDFNEYKPKIQKLIREKSGYEVAIRGDIALSLSPLGISILEVEVFNPYYKDEIPFAKLGSFNIALEIMPLFDKEIKISHIALENLTLLIEKVKERKFNFDIPQSKTSTTKIKNNTSEKEDEFPLVNVKNINFINANINYIDLVNKRKIVMEQINFNMSDINYDPTKSALQALSFKADAIANQIKSDKYTLKEVEMNLVMEDAVVSAENLKYSLFDSIFQGSGKVDLSGKLPKIVIKNKVEELKLVNLSKEVFGQDILAGMANGCIKLAFTLGDAQTIKSTLSGYVELAADNVALKGYDVDKIVTIVSENKKELKGGIFNNLLTGSYKGIKGENSILKQLNTKVDIGYSKATLSDVAFSTNQNRVALKGDIQIVEEKILGVTAGFLNPNGCTTFEQTINGTLSKPTLKIDEKTMDTAKNAVISNFSKAKDINIESKQEVETCIPFYTGVVKHSK